MADKNKKQSDSAELPEQLSAKKRDFPEWMSQVLQLAGVKDAVAKMLGSKNKISNVMATIDALDAITAPDEIRERRLGKKTKAKSDKK